MGYSPLNPQIAIKMGTMVTIIHRNRGQVSDPSLQHDVKPFYQRTQKPFPLCRFEPMQAYSVTCEETRQAAAKYIWDGLGQNGSGTM